MNDGPAQKDHSESFWGKLRRTRTRTIALWALAIAIGHVIYHALRDHVFPDAY